MPIGAEMVKLSYTTICSLDGYSEDADGGFGWAAPDEEVHAFVNDLERPIGTCSYPFARSPPGPRDREHRTSSPQRGGSVSKTGPPTFLGPPAAGIAR